MLHQRDAYNHITWPLLGKSAVTSASWLLVENFWPTQLQTTAYIFDCEHYVLLVTQSTKQNTSSHRCLHRFTNLDFNTSSIIQFYVGICLLFVYIRVFDVNTSRIFATCAADQVSKFLRRHPEFLERYITEEVEFSKLQKWTSRRSQRQKRNPARSTNSVRKYSAYQDKDQMLQDLTHKLQLKDSKEYTLWDLANCLCSAVHAEGFR